MKPPSASCLTSAWPGIRRLADVLRAHHDERLGHALEMGISAMGECRIGTLGVRFGFRLPPPGERSLVALC